MLLSYFSRRVKCRRTPTSASLLWTRFMTEDITLKMNINPKFYNLFQIGASVNITHNVKMFRISLPNPESVVNFESIPSYVILKTDEQKGQTEGNRYTPISYSDQVRKYSVTTYHHTIFYTLKCSSEHF